MDRLKKRLMQLMMAYTTTSPRDLRNAAFLFVYFFLVITSYYLIKPVRNSLFLDRLGADKLPYVYLATGILAGGIVSLYNLLAARTGLRSLIYGSQLVLASNLVFFRYALSWQTVWMSAVFYLWVNLFSVFVVSQFWLTASHVFTAREAKRFYGPVGAGGILGGVVGSASSGFLAKLIGTENVLWAAAAVLCLTLPVVRALGPRSEWVPAAGSAQPQESRPGFKMLITSGHLRALAVVMGIMTVVSTFVDYQFNVLVDASIPGRDEKTAFFGKFFAGLNVVSFIFQAVLTTPILRRFGIGTALLLLPLSLLAGSAYAVILPSLSAAIILKVGDGSIRYSLDQATREVLFVPVPPSDRPRAKAAIDIFINRFSKGAAALLLLGLSAGLHWGVSRISLVVIGMIVVWALVTRTLRREYVRSIASLLRTRSFSVADAPNPLAGREAERLLKGYLSEPDEEKLLYVLNLVPLVRIESLVPDLLPLLRHPSQKIRARTIQLLGLLGHRRCFHDVQLLMADPSIEVRTEATHYVCAYQCMDPSDMMTKLLASSNLADKGPALVCACRLPGKKARAAQQEFVRQLKNWKRPEERMQSISTLAWALGTVPPASPLRGMLVGLAEHDSGQVREAALEAMGRSRDPRFIPVLTRFLDDPQWRRAARKSLVAIASPQSDPVSDHLDHVSLRPETRERLFRIILEANGPTAVGKLIAWLERPDLIPRIRVLRGLNRLASKGGNVHAAPRFVRAMLYEEVRLYYKVFVRLYSLDPSALAPGRTVSSISPLIRTLQERLLRHLESVLLLLQLTFPSPALRSASSFVRRDDPFLLSNLAELLENLVKGDLKDLILPLVDERPIEHKLAIASADFGVQAEGREPTLAELARGEDPWLRACTIHYRRAWEEAAAA